MAKDLTTEDTESTEGATPETDAHIKTLEETPWSDWVYADFARKLERRLKDQTRSAHFGPPSATGIILDADLVASIIEPWREIAARLALACIADGGDFRQEVLRDYRKMLEEEAE